MCIRVLNALLVGVFVLSVSGCTTATAPAVPREAQSTGIVRESSGTGKAFAYACDGLKACYTFDSSGQVIGTLKGLDKPTATTTDAAGNW